MNELEVKEQMKIVTRVLDLRKINYDKEYGYNLLEQERKTNYIEIDTNGNRIINNDYIYLEKAMHAFINNIVNNYGYFIQAFNLELEIKENNCSSEFCTKSNLISCLNVLETLYAIKVLVSSKEKVIK